MFNIGGCEGLFKYCLMCVFESYVVVCVDVVVMICCGFKDDFVVWGNVLEWIMVIFNGVDFVLFGVLLSCDVVLVVEFGLGDGLVIGFIGSFYDYEGIDDLIVVMLGLIVCWFDVWLLLVGGGFCEVVFKV